MSGGVTNKQKTYILTHNDGSMRLVLVLIYSTIYTWLKTTIYFFRFSMFRVFSPTKNVLMDPPRARCVRYSPIEATHAVEGQRTVTWKLGMTRLRWLRPLLRPGTDRPCMGVLPKNMGIPFFNWVGFHPLCGCFTKISGGYFPNHPIFNKVFHYKLPSILGETPLFLET